MGTFGQSLLLPRLAKLRLLVNAREIALRTNFSSVLQKSRAFSLHHHNSFILVISSSIKHQQLARDVSGLSEGAKFGWIGPYEIVKPAMDGAEGVEVPPL